MSINQRGGHDVMLREDAAMRRRRKQDQQNRVHALQTLKCSLALMPQPLETGRLQHNDLIAH
ncbi:hypothetical protein [Kushneria phosphatilytica]|uniref:Uncharacterized protein n=1 Tax=Kushneria phosphatilytica TaxID=657387 RepID=A0A1S1NX64_9GAMM|nr:hypothetical protein [Kushneria phosphatilytica]OHV11966.1 hypothetical protein BH688_04645 [Kushneria phosphatilytica]QEL11151.1 hypothetical protein FY550_08395 [Kushneria phosphatilytica]